MSVITGRFNKMQNKTHYLYNFKERYFNHHIYLGYNDYI